MREKLVEITINKMKMLLRRINTLMTESGLTATEQSEVSSQLRKFVDCWSVFED